MKKALRERRDAICEALESELPDASFERPQGGYFLWVDLPDGTDVTKLEDSAKERGVEFVKGTDFFVEGGDSSMRLAYSAVTPEEIEQGIARIGEAFRELAGAAA